MILDQIRKQKILSSPETINSDWASPSFSLDDREGNFSVSLKYDNGSNVVMKVYFQVSNDDINFGDVPDYDGLVRPAELHESSGVVIFDLPGSGTAYARIRIEVFNGSMDILEINVVASQRH